MSTNDFVKATGRDKLWEVMAEEMKALQGQDGMLKKELERPVNCALCGIDDTDPVFIKEGFRFVKCRKCGLLYVNPQADSTKLVSWYQQCASMDMWVDMVLRSGPQNDYDTKKFQGCEKTLHKLCGNRGKVLDIGCSMGNFLLVARDAGWDAKGLELNEKAVKYAVETLKLDVRPLLLHETDFELESFDAITLWEVLEHVPDPSGLLKDCAKYLRPGGIIAILVPNKNALSAMIMQEHCSCFGGRNHLWYFSKEALSYLLVKEGFSPIEDETKTMLSQINEILGYMSYRNPYLSPVDKNDFVLDDDIKSKLEKFIYDNHLGYKLLMYAKKR